MSIKLVLFVCAVFISVQYGNSLPDEFGTFWGPCPAAPINASSTVYITDMLGKWYTHRVLGLYSPWKYFDCQKSTISSNPKQKTFDVSTQFEVAGTPFPFEWNGTVEAIDQKKAIFDSYYSIGGGWLILQTGTILQKYRQGAMLAWSCLDFGFFHFETISVMTKYQDPNDSRVDSYVYRNMNKTLINAGISPNWFEPINQQYCESDSSSSTSSFLTSSFAAIKGLKSTAINAFFKRL